MKNFSLIILTAFLFFKNSSAQTLINNFPVLNTGGYINCIIEDTISNKVFIAGNFTTVNGNARKNIARLSYSPTTNNYTLDNWTPITSMVGEIKTIAKYNNQLYLGGDFTSINGNSSYQFFSRLTNILFTPILDASFNPAQNGPIYKINDLIIENNLLYIGGINAVWDSGTEYRSNFATYDLVSNSISSFDVFNSLNGLNWGILEIEKMHFTNDRIYLCGRNFGGPSNDGIIALDKSTLNLINSFNPSFTFEKVIDCEVYNGKVYIINSQTWPYAYGILELDESNGNTLAGSFNITGSGVANCIERYKNYLFIGGSYQYFQTQNQNYFGIVDLNSNNQPKSILSWNPTPNSAIDSPRGLKIIRNRLYISDNNLTNISSTNKNGMAAYCLEPYNTQNFISPTLSVCPNQNANYTINSVPYAEGYTWWYDGTNTNLSGAGTTINLYFSENATSGVLYVSPYSFCNLYSDTLSIAITVNPRPNANAGLDSTLNCFRFFLDLNGSSTTPNVGYSWTGPAFGSSNQNPTINDDGEYVLTVTNTVTGCTKKDTVLITLDTIKPDVILPAPPFILTCADTTVLLNGSCLDTLHATSLYWNKVSGPIFPNPFYCDTIGQYYLVVKDLVNGCKDSSSIVVSENRSSPNIELISHSGIASLTKDTLTCLKDSILMVGGSSTTNTIFHWEDTTGIISNNDSLLVINSDGFALVVTDTVNGCKSNLNFFIAEYTTPPQLNLPTGITDITCSIDSVTLDGSSSTPNTIQTWAGPNAYFSNDPAIVNDTGIYIFTVTRNDNGCMAQDSITVNQIPIILIESSSDTLVCSGSDVIITSNAIGNFGTLNYQWSNGLPNSNSVLVSPLDSTTYYIQVSDGNGCIGYDSITVNISPALSDSVLTFASCDSTIGEIQIYASGGIFPYIYSIDNGNTFQSSSIFNVPYGNYDIVIQDSIGCQHYTQASVNHNSQLPAPDFLVSTYSYLEDTLILVNISNPIPDSVEWIFPIGTDVLYEDEFYAMIILPDTGTYSVTLKAIYGNCFSDLSKTIHVRDNDSTIANFYNQNGIDSVIIYPNPNDGNFNLEITLFKKQNFSIQIFDLTGSRWYNETRYEEDFYQSNIQLNNIPDGTYILRIIAEFDARHYYFVISH